MLRLVCCLAVLGCVPAPAALDAGFAEDALPSDAQPIDASPRDADPADAEATDSGDDPPDSGDPPDTGVPSHCPTAVNPACASQETCGTDMPPPTNCDACVPSNFALCVEGACEMPPTLDVADVYAIATTVAPTVPLLESIGAFALAARTAGDALVTCEDVYAGTVDFADRCYNMLDSKSIAVSQTGDTYTVAFDGFASSQHTLFILVGYTQIGARGDPVGVSCTELDVGPPMGGSMQFFAGDPMRPL